MCHVISDAPLISDVVADRVFGQPDFSSATSNNGGISAASLAGPAGIAVDSSGRVAIVDAGNSRVLIYDAPLPEPTLAIISLGPSEAVAGAAALTLTVRGTRFTAGATVRWNDAARPTTFVSSSQLTAQLTAADIAATGPVSITVAAPDDAISSPRALTLYAAMDSDPIADRVLGQPSRHEDTPKYGGAGPVGLYQPVAIAIHSGSGRLFVADTFNHRVLSWPDAAAFANGQAADLVIGQPRFDLNLLNQGGAVGATTLYFPAGVAVDADGNLYVADLYNNRVLEYAAPLSSGLAASRVFGQPDFSSSTPNTGGISAGSLNRPLGVAVDGAGNLYVADGNSRVLEYDAPLSSDTAADRVFGQPDLTSATPNNGGVSASSLYRPWGVALDGRGNLYVADVANHRVLEYDAPLTSDAVADRVFGQPDFASNTANNQGVGPHALSEPKGVAVDGWGNLYVADGANYRVLEYDAPLTSDAIADRVFGQPDFTTTGSDTGGVSASSLDAPWGVATDAHDNLYIADTYNNRALEYDWPVADARVFLPLVGR